MNRTSDEQGLEDAAWGEEVFRYVKDIMGLKPADAIIALATALGMAISRADDKATPAHFSAVFQTIGGAWQCDQEGDFPNSPKPSPLPETPEAA